MLTATGRALHPQSPRELGRVGPLSAYRNRRKLMHKLTSCTPVIILAFSGALALAQNQQPPGGNNPSTRAGAGAAGGNPQTAPARRGGGRGRGNQDPDMVFTRPNDSPG